MAFSSDGTKMFILGSFDDDVNEYTLTAPFDISTATFTNVTFSVVKEEGNPQGMAFSSDGSKMFVVGPFGGNVNEYTLTAPFDISTAAFANVTFSVSTEDGTPTGMAFSSDGATMFVVGSAEDNVNEYALSSVYPIVVVTNTPPPDDAFVTTWEVETSPYVIHVPVEIRSGATATIDWGDGSTTDVSANGTQQHTYATAGNYTVAITGGLGRINLNGSPSADKLASLDQWGDIAWTTMKEAFRKATSMVYNATDAPDLSGVTSMQNMFRGAEKFDGDLSGWDVSGVANMDGTFRGASAFDGDLSAWDTSGANDTRKMFQDATTFNGDISSWNTTGVTHMDSMFRGAEAFNGNISGWNTSSVEKMQLMFLGATDFNADISGWDVSGVTNMADMFNVATAFNQDLSGWNVSSVTDMPGMFNEAIAFNGNLSGWNVSSVTDMDGMFRGATAFNRDISSWNVSAVTHMASMFEGATAFNGDISGWNVSAVTSFSGMFQGATSFDQNLGEWYIVLNSTEIDAGDAPGVVGSISAQNSILAGQATYGIGMGGDSTSFNITGGSDLNMNVSSPAKPLYTVNITSTGGFGDNNHRAYNVTVTGIDTTTPPPDEAFVTTWEVETSPYVIHMPVEIRSGATATIDWGDGSTTDVGANGRQDHTYAAAGNYTVAVTGGLGRINLNESPSADKLASLDQWGDMEWTTMNNAFRNAVNMAYDATDAPDLSGVTSTSLMFANALSFDGDLSGWDVSRVTNMKEMFTRAGSFNGDISTWNVSGVTDMNGMFEGAAAFDGDISSWNTSGVTDMESMFSDASSFNGDISGWNVSSVKNMENTFNSAVKFNQDLSGWDVSSVEKMSLMFHGTTDFNQNLSSWNVSSVTAMFGMFQDAAAFNGDLSGWNPASLITATWMFKNAPAFDGDLSGWDVSRVDSMAGMFHGATDFDGDISTWNVSSVADMTDMFHGATAFNGNVSAWDVSKVSLMENMFRGATDFDGDLSGWNVLGAFFMNNMFRGATTFNSDISDWDVSNVFNMNGMFDRRHVVPAEPGQMVHRAGRSFHKCRRRARRGRFHTDAKPLP